MLFLYFVLSLRYCLLCSSFFFNDTATTEIYTLSLHDALPIWDPNVAAFCPSQCLQSLDERGTISEPRSEEHTSELQSQSNLVCRLLLEKKKKKNLKLCNLKKKKKTIKK